MANSNDVLLFIQRCKAIRGKRFYLDVQSPDYNEDSDEDDEFVQFDRVVFCSYCGWPSDIVHYANDPVRDVCSACMRLEADGNMDAALSAYYAYLADLGKVKQAQLEAEKEQLRARIYEAMAKSQALINSEVDKA